MRKIKKTNKISKTFSVALFFAFLFWALIKLSKEYKTVISFPVVYSNLPQDKLIQKEPLHKIDIQIKASGFRLIGMNVMTKTIKLDASKLQRKSFSDYYFLAKNQTIEIQNQISNAATIDFIVQDTMYLNLGVLTSKRVPIIGNFDLTYKLGYHLTKPLKIEPDSILVSGPEEQIDTLQHLQLQKLTMNDVSKSIQTTLPIIGASSTIKFGIKEAEVYGEIDRFTEGVLELPFEIIHLPDSISVNTFPKTLKVIYQVGLTNFNKINANSFKIVCDFQNAQRNNLNYLIPKVTVKPDFVTSVKLNPNKIEFLIQK